MNNFSNQIYYKTPEIYNITPKRKLEFDPCVGSGKTTKKKRKRDPIVSMTPTIPHHAFKSPL